MKILCYLEAIPFFFKSGVWSPHLYEEVSRNKGIVIASDNGFRVADNMLHERGEVVHPRATIIKNRCVHCGHEDLSWYDNEPIVIGN